MNDPFILEGTMAEQMILHFDLDSVYKDKVDAFNPSDDDSDNSTIESVGVNNENPNEDENDYVSDKTATKERKPVQLAVVEHHLLPNSRCSLEIQTRVGTRKRAISESADSISNFLGKQENPGINPGEDSLKMGNYCETSLAERKRARSCLDSVQSCRREVDGECEAEHGNWICD